MGLARIVLPAHSIPPRATLYVSRRPPDPQPTRVGSQYFFAAGDHLFFTLDGDQRDLGRGKQAYRRATGAGPEVDVQQPPVGQSGESGVHAIDQTRQINEREYLAAMDVPGEL